MVRELNLTHPVHALFPVVSGVIRTEEKPILLQLHLAAIPINHAQGENWT